MTNSAAPDSFAHLHVASSVSMQYGTSTPAALVARAAEHGQKLLALTDRDTVGGAVAFIQACQAAGIRPILGIDLALEPTGVLPIQHDAAQRAAVHRPSPARGGAAIERHRSRVVLLARGAAGWSTIVRLLSEAHLSGERGEPVIAVPDLLRHLGQAPVPACVAVMLGPTSEVGRALAARRPDLARAIVAPWVEVLGPAAVHLEVLTHRARDATYIPNGTNGDRVHGVALSTAGAARMFGLARDLGLPAVLTNAVRYASPEQARTADVLDAVRRLVPLHPRHLDRATGEGHLKSSEQMARVAADIATAAGFGASSARELMQATVDLAASCVIDPAHDLGLDRVHVPELDVVLAGRALAAPTTWQARRRSSAQIRAEAARADAVLRGRCESGLGWRGLVHDKVALARLDDELGVIAQLGFAGYFLTVAEVTDLIRQRGIRVAARGSGAGSLVTYALGISGVDPLRHNLLMERFCSPLRPGLPDIDIDVESARREEIYRAVLERFGGERAIAVSMRETYRVRHAVRDVGAALGLPPGEVDALAKAFPHIRARDARAALSELPELRSSALGRLAAEGRLEGFLGLVESLDGLPRHLAMHPCGMVLSDAALLDRTPVESSAAGFPMTPFDKDEVEALGLLKLDILGIRMQSAMAYAISEVARVDGIQITLDAVPHDDSATFELIKSTRTLGCFQIESPGQRELVGKLAPETFDDLIVDISLFRPGPVKSDMVTPYLRGRHGWITPDIMHPDLESVLADTYGVVVFHEQVMQLMSVLGGCTLAEADEHRRAMGKSEGHDAVRAWFYPAALRRGYSLDVVERVWDVLAAFASFGFCKAHAAAFALPTYHSAWLKTHHPAAFFAGLLTHDPGMYPKRLILDDARHLGIAVLPLDINRSGIEYRVERAESDHAQHRLPKATNYGIRLAFSDVRGLSEVEGERIVSAQPFDSLTDFWHRAGVARPVAERLVLAGAFDSVHGIEATTVAMTRRSRITRRDLLLALADLDRGSRAASRAGAVSGRSALRRTAGVRSTASDPAIRAATQVGASSRAAAPHVTQQPTQLAFDLPDPLLSGPSGLPELTPSERVHAELEVLGLDASQHLMTFYRDVLRELRVMPARDLLSCRNGSSVLVAGVKVATQTPPIRSGTRVIFLTLDDSTGPADAAFFEDAQGDYAATLFSSWLLLVRGVVRRSGPRGVSIRGTGCWELGAIAAMQREAGTAAVFDMLAAAPDPSRRARGKQGVSGVGDTSGKRRVLVHPSGFRQSPWADIAPVAPPTKLWHASPGSSGW